jgi:hypothetical protein
MAIHSSKCVEASGSLQTMALQTADATRSSLIYLSCGNIKDTNVSRRLLMTPITCRIAYEPFQYTKVLSCFCD